jgi:hypothetical protein
MAITSAVETPPRAAFARGPVTTLSSPGRPLGTDFGTDTWDSGFMFTLADVTAMFRRDDRAVTVQIGAILAFGILILGLSVFQVAVVPQENKRVEFNSYVGTTNDLTDVRNDLLAAGTAGATAGTTVRTGARYPARAVLINPPPAAGSVATGSERTVTIDGVVAVTGEDANTRGFWNTTAHGPRSYSTRAVRFDPGYNELDVPPIVVTPTAAYRLTDGGPLPLTGQSFVSGTRITLVTVDGDVSAVGDGVTLTADPVSTTTRTVTVTGTGDEFTITLPVEGGAAAFNESQLADEIRANPAVRRTAVNGSAIDVVFDGSRTYDLRLARVAVRDDGGSTAETPPAPQYLVPLAGDGTAVPTTGARRIAVEVRDAYNNPVGGVDVAFTASNGQLPTGATATVTTGPDGRAGVPFDIADDADTATLYARIDGAGVTPHNESTVELIRQGTDAAGGTDDINPSRGGDVILEGAVEGGSKNEVVVSFNNSAASPQTIEKARISFYFQDQNSDRATSATIGAVTFDVPGVAKDPGVSLGTGSGQTVDVSFQGSGGKSVDTGDTFFILTVWFDGVGQETYFVAVDPSGGGGNGNGNGGGNGNGRGAGS